MGVDRFWNRNGVESCHPLAAATIRSVRAARLQPMIHRHSAPSPLGCTIARATSFDKAKIQTGHSKLRVNYARPTKAVREGIGRRHRVARETFACLRRCSDIDNKRRKPDRSVCVRVVALLCDATKRRGMCPNEAMPPSLFWAFLIPSFMGAGPAPSIRPRRLWPASAPWQKANFRRSARYLRLMSTTSMLSVRSEPPRFTVSRTVPGSLMRSRTSVKSESLRTDLPSTPTMMSPTVPVL
jgi:hypothetical protein